MTSRLHLAIEDWLSKLELHNYIHLFKEYNGVEEILHLSEKDLRNMGVRNQSHRARMATSLHVLKEKYIRAYKNRSPNVSMTTLRPDNLNKSLESASSVSNVQLDILSSGVRSWPSSGPSSLTHSRQSSYRSSMEGSIATDASPEELKIALERELSLDGSDLRSYAWYHGTILRQRAEELVVNDGDFIVRDCISQPGDYVITCRWKGVPLHFIVNKVILQPDTVYEKIQYCFEKDSFDSIPDFITYYVGSKYPLSSCLGATIMNPINRSMPLTYYASRYGVQCQIHYAAKALEKIPSQHKGVNESNKKASPSKQISNENENPMGHCTALTPDCYMKDSNGEKNPGYEYPVTQQRKLIKVGSDPNLNPNAEKRTFEHRPNSGTFATDSIKEMTLKIEGDKAPPKPSRVPSKKCVQRPLIVKRERKNTPPTPLQELMNHGELFNQNRSLETSNKSCLNDESVRKHSIPPKRMISGETRFSFLDRPSVSSDGSVSDMEAVDVLFTIPLLHPNSSFNPSEFYSPLISRENKPLEKEVLNQAKKILLSETSRNLACHMTQIDLEVLKNFGDRDLGLGVTSGLELILLPQGHRLIKDMLERIQCVKLFVAVTILTCTSEEERAQVLNKWIQIAVDTRNILGNLLGFAGIMLGLTVPEVFNLQATWLMLRQLHTETTFNFETKLRPAFKAMQENSVESAPNTCIPYILSLLQIFEHHWTVMQSLQGESLSLEIPENFLSFDIRGEQSSSDFGVQILQNHLEMSRNFLFHWQVFRSNADIILKDVVYDNLLLDIFRTEFHMRMLWGCRGAVVNSEERHWKFAQVLKALSSMCQ